jgi:hypothetical protein
MVSMRLLFPHRTPDFGSREGAKARRKKNKTLIPTFSRKREKGSIGASLSNPLPLAGLGRQACPPDRPKSRPNGRVRVFLLFLLRAFAPLREQMGSGGGRWSSPSTSLRLVPLPVPGRNF